MKRSAVNQESTRIRLDKPLVKSVLQVITAITHWVLWLCTMIQSVLKVGVFMYL